VDAERLAKVLNIDDHGSLRSLVRGAQCEV
jgi:hypothetical protein